MYNDYIIPIIIGLLGVLLAMLPGKFEDAELWLKINFIAVYIMIIIGIIAFILFIIELLS